MNVIRKNKQALQMTPHIRSGPKKRASWFREASEFDAGHYPLTNSRDVSNISSWNHSHDETETESDDHRIKLELMALNPKFAQTQDFSPRGLKVLITHLPSSYKKSDMVVKTFDFLLHHPHGATPKFLAVKAIYDVVPKVQSGDLLIRFHLTIFHNSLPHQTVAKMKARAKLYRYDQDAFRFKPLGKARINLAFLDL